MDYSKYLLIAFEFTIHPQPALTPVPSPGRSATYYVNHSDLPNKKIRQHLVVVYAQKKTLAKELEEVLGYGNEAIPVRVLFHVSLLDVVQRCVQNKLKCELVKLSDTLSNLGLRQEKLAENILAGTKKREDLTTDQVIFPAIFGVGEPITIRNGEHLMDLEECEAYVRKILSVVSTVEDLALGQNALLKRDVLIYSWLLQKREDSVRLDRVVHYLASSDVMKESVKNTVLNFVADEHFRMIGEDEFEITDIMMQGFQNVFDSPHSYKLMHPVTYLGRERGIRVLEYFSRISPASNLAAMVCNAFTKPLQLPGAMKIDVDGVEGDYYLISKPGSWSFILSIISKDGAFDRPDLNAVVTDLNLVRRQQNMDLPLFLFVPVSENYQITTKFPSLYQVWAITAIGFFHLLEDVITECGSTRISDVAEKFNEIIPPDGVSFSSTRAINSLREALQLKKL